MIYKDSWQKIHDKEKDNESYILELKIIKRENITYIFKL